MASDSGGLLSLEGEGVCDHGDELRIRGFSLGVGDRVAEVLLQNLDVAAVPGHLDGMADFGAFSPNFLCPLSPFTAAPL